MDRAAKPGLVDRVSTVTAAGPTATAPNRSIGSRGARRHGVPCSAGPVPPGPALITPSQLLPTRVRTERPPRLRDDTLQLHIYGLLRRFRSRRPCLQRESSSYTRGLRGRLTIARRSSHRSRILLPIDRASSSSGSPVPRESYGARALVLCFGQASPLSPGLLTSTVFSIHFQDFQGLQPLAGSYPFLVRFPAVRRFCSWRDGGFGVRTPITGRSRVGLRRCVAPCVQPCELR